MEHARGLLPRPDDIPWLNGAVTAEWSECPLEKGHIGLQAEFYDLEFRNLKFKPLP